MTVPDTLDAAMWLLGALAYALEAAELYTVAAVVDLASGPHRTHAERARLLHDQTDRIPVAGRQIYFRTACVWLARTFDALHVGDTEEAARWLDKASHEFERYAEATPSDVRTVESRITSNVLVDTDTGGHL